MCNKQVCLEGDCILWIITKKCLQSLQNLEKKKNFIYLPLEDRPGPAFHFSYLGEPETQNRVYCKWLKIGADSSQKKYLKSCNFISNQTYLNLKTPVFYPLKFYHLNRPHCWQGTSHWWKWVITPHTAVVLSTSTKRQVVDCTYRDSEGLLLGAYPLQKTQKE